MASTIQLDEGTISVLKRLKETYGIRTYDEVIRKLVHRKAPRSMHGVLAGKKKYRMKDILTNLRDENERV